MYFGRLHIFSFGHFRIFFLIIVTDQPYQCTSYSLRKSGEMDIADSVRPQFLFQKFLFFLCGIGESTVLANRKLVPMLVDYFKKYWS